MDVRVKKAEVSCGPVERGGASGRRWSIGCMSPSFGHRSLYHP